MMAQREITEDSLMVAGGERSPVGLTVKEYAAVERVDERTVRRWVTKQAVPYRRTPGGGIRILVRPSA